MTGPSAPLASRRIVLTGLGAVGAAAALAGCAGGADDDADTRPRLKAGTLLAGAAEVPVGGGLVLTDQKVVLTQPSAGVFKAFTAVCTHRRLTVTSVEDNRILCDYHGSSYAADSGEVEGGPATSALAEVAIVVDGDRILAA